LRIAFALSEPDYTNNFMRIVWTPSLDMHSADTVVTELRAQ
jgi:hypothetical protein